MRAGWGRRLRQWADSALRCWCYLAITHFDLVSWRLWRAVLVYGVAEDESEPEIGVVNGSLGLQRAC
jgi:hypothetical protein